MNYIPYLLYSNIVFTVITLVAMLFYGRPAYVPVPEEQLHIASLLLYIVCTMILIIGQRTNVHENNLYLLRKHILRSGIMDLSRDHQRDRYIVNQSLITHMLLIGSVLLPIAALLYLSIDHICVVPIIIGLYVHAYIVHRKAFRLLGEHIIHERTTQPIDAFMYQKGFFAWVNIVVQGCILYTLVYPHLQ